MQFSVIIPCYNASTRIIPTLDSLSNQTYRDFEVIIVTRDTNDSANAMVREAVRESRMGRLVYSGRAVACGQKNHNLIAGVSAADNESQILVFCDSTLIQSGIGADRGCYTFRVDFYPGYATTSGR